MTGRMASVQMVQLKDCAEVLPGFSTQGAIEHDQNGTHYVIISRHLNENEPYRYDTANELRITPPRSADKYLLKPKDILFMSRGSKNSSVILESIPEPSIAPLSFYVIRAKSNINPYYLVWCLNQSNVDSQLNMIRTTGAATPMIPRDALQEITIPLPPIEVQNKIAMLGEYMAKERILLARLEEETQRYHRLLAQRILSFTGKNAKESITS